MGIRSSPRLAATMLLVMALAGGCAAGAPPPTASSAAPAAALPTYAYPLSGGDKVRVVVFGNPNLGGDFTIGGSGFISLPLIGEVEVRGLTSTQVQDRITTRLAAGYLKEPRVAVELLGTRPYYILGEVNRPGEYPFADGLTVFGAIAQAGGYTYRAKTRQILIKHAGEDTESAYTVTSSMKIAPGDVIRVKERWF